eukprot:scpid53899/ scgid15577/ 
MRMVWFYESCKTIYGSDDRGMNNKMQHMSNGVTYVGERRGKALYHSSWPFLSVCAWQSRWPCTTKTSLQREKGKRLLMNTCHQQQLSMPKTGHEQQPNYKNMYNNDGNVQHVHTCTSTRATTCVQRVTLRTQQRQYMKPRQFFAPQRHGMRSRRLGDEVGEYG